MTAPRATIKSRIEQALHRRSGRTASLDALLLDLPDVTRKQLRSNLDYLRKLGRIANQGTQNESAWMLIVPISRCDLGELSAGKPKAPDPAPARRHPEIIWPEHVKVQRAPTSFSVELYQPAKRGYQRPEGDDSLSCPSRRGNEYVQHRSAMGACASSVRNKRGAS